jgi:hypothetical protein
VSPSSFPILLFLLLLSFLLPIQCSDPHNFASRIWNVKLLVSKTRLPQPFTKVSPFVVYLFPCIYSFSHLTVSFGCNEITVHLNLNTETS